MERTAAEPEVPEALRLELAGLFHDMNNLVCTLVGNAELAASSLPGDHPTLKELGAISIAGRRLRELVEQGTGQLVDRVPMSRRFRVDEAIGSLVRLVRPQLAREATIRAERLDPVEVDLPKAQFDRVVANLVGNAIRAVGPGGTVGIEAGVVHAEGSTVTRGRTLPPGPYLRLVVEDDGEGIDAGLLGHIFQPGFTRHANEGGRGLGLAVVDDLVAQWQGGIEVESEPGQGAHFTVWIPLPTT